MRQVFSSPRLENVEGVAQMLRDAGIDIRVTDARGYKQVSRREFSYVPSQQERSGTQPAVWVINADDYKRARDMLVDGGLLDDAKTSVSYLPEPLQVQARPTEPASARIGRVRLALLFIVGALAFWTFLRLTVLR
jgi:hypothetical protein